MGSQFLSSLAVLASTLLLLSSASPISLSSDALSVVSRRLQGTGVSQATFDDLLLMRQFASASYCPGNDGSTSLQKRTQTKISCPARYVDFAACPALEADDTEILSSCYETGILSGSAFVAVDNTQKMIVISVRGTTDIRNWLANLDIIHHRPETLFADCKDCRVHAGFWRAWNEVRAVVYEAAKAAATTYPEYKVRVVGHSLGGAIATLCAAEMRQDAVFGDRAVDLYTFGSPRVLNGAMADRMSGASAATGVNVRVTHRNDVVPHMPLAATGFKHLDPEYYVSSETGKEVVAADILLQTMESRGGADQWDLLRTTVPAHKWYFGTIDACSDGFEGWKE